MNENGGYITLLSAIIISSVLMIMMYEQSLTGFFARASVLNQEKKTASFYLAMSCVEKIKLKLAEDAGYLGGEFLKISDGECEIGNIDRQGENFNFYVSVKVGIIKSAHTDLSVEINKNTGVLSISENLIQ